MNLSKLNVKINQDFAFSNFMMRGGKSEAVFFPGCAFMKFGKDFIDKVLSVLREVEKDMKACSLCCAYPSQVLDKKYHQKNKIKIVDFMNKKGVKRVYTACPNCYNMLSKLKEEFGLSYEIEMLYNNLNKNLDKIKTYHPLDEEVVMHDPCVIRKDSVSQNSVREILQKINQKYIEPANTKDKTICCGNINMIHILNKKESAYIRKLRVDGLKKYAGTILSYCSGCLQTLGKEKINTVHIMELIFGKQKNINYVNRILFTRGLKND